MIIRIKEAIYNFINGIWSGMPFCCVIFFVKKSWIYQCDTAYHVENKRNNVIYCTERGMKLKEIPEHEYVACDKCTLHKTFVKIKENGIICQWLIS